MTSAILCVEWWGQVKLSEFPPRWHSGWEQGGVCPACIPCDFHQPATNHPMKKSMWREDTQLENLNWAVLNQVGPESHQSRLPYGNLDWFMIACVFVFLSIRLYDWPDLCRKDCLLSVCIPWSPKLPPYFTPHFLRGNVAPQGFPTVMNEGMEEPMGWDRIFCNGMEDGDGIG